MKHYVIFYSGQRSCKTNNDELLTAEEIREMFALYCDRRREETFPFVELDTYDEAEAMAKFEKCVSTATLGKSYSPWPYEWDIELYCLDISDVELDKAGKIDDEDNFQTVWGKMKISKR